MKNILVFLLFLLIGLAAFLGYDYLFPNKFFKSALRPTIKTQFSLNKAPSISLPGTIASLSGQVNWLPRNATKPVQLKASRSIQQGEELSTGKNGKADVVINNYSALSLSSDTHINFVQLLPINFVIEQDKGTVMYQNTLRVPISVKSFDVITLMTNGITNVSVDSVDKTVTVAVIKGNVTEGYKDMQDMSNVITVQTGQQFVFDDTTRVGTVTGEALTTPSFSIH